MHVFGCASWADFLARTAFPLPEGAEPLLAAIWDEGGRATAALAWRDGSAFRWDLDSVPSGRAAAVAAADGEDADPWPSLDRTPEDVADRMLDLALSERMALAGLGYRIPALPAGMPAALEGVARSILASVDAWPVWAATCTTGEYDDVYTATAALYGDPATAVAHAAAAEMHEEAQEGGEDFDAPGRWSVSVRTMRASLPAHLRPYADGTARPPVRPSRYRDSEDGWVVEVPERGTVSFPGYEGEGLSAKLLRGLPLAKPTLKDRMASEDERAVGLRQVSPTELAWEWSSWKDMPVQQGRAVAEGPDAEGLIRDLLAAAAVRYRPAYLDEPLAPLDDEEDQDAEAEAG